ncbi:hypothetical protein EMIHUDRAFT_470646 [Emiliania huxleyi CCMP1516]|uniref:TIR domain-containing protein n=2 Tax=Emiliania huxleyi TaxID=2903 RepID=A0A0D3ISF7_EMIH1|nr:hypothetical protein EMIHUDRAFT_470646 [Emiliania huxleyi CCMP1516]EOD14192.1 hypothetical protein EMIHUDRAFT_470646 [Emiliania huxleyi CCMP1516]|eukprot:XP_005766621.1 hypothetical protein EMIHUDRAFT_470646 [Emiliania huxleyi CCMP1516]
MLVLAFLATPSAATRPPTWDGEALIVTHNRTDFCVKRPTDAPALALAASASCEPNKAAELVDDLTWEGAALFGAWPDATFHQNFSFPTKFSKPTGAASCTAGPTTLKHIGAAADAEFTSFDEPSRATKISGPSPEESFTIAAHSEIEELLVLHPCAAVLALLAACSGLLLRGQQVRKKRVDGCSHAAISVPLLSSARALRVGIVLIFLQDVCGTPAAPLQTVNVSSPCSLTDGGSCAASPNYPNSYGSNEKCTISGVPPVELEMVAFDVEGNNCRYDYLTVNGVKYCGKSGPDGAVAEGGVIEWESDGIHVRSGWKARPWSLSLPFFLLSDAYPPSAVRSAGRPAAFTAATATTVITAITAITASRSAAVTAAAAVTACSAGDVEIIESTVRDCSADEAGGGVVYAYNSGAVSIIGSTNGVVVYAYRNSGAVSITSSNVSGCSAGNYGGVVYAWNSGAVSISSSNMSGCSATGLSQEGNGGVVWAHGSGAVSILDSTVSGCSAGQWGGVVYADKSESLSIAGVDFINNGAARSGSVLYLSVLTQRSSISDASFTGNDGVTIQTDSPIDWDCRLGSWMPTEGALKGDVNAPECYLCPAGYFGNTSGLTTSSCSGQRATRIESAVGLQPKFKVFVSFYQVSSALGLVYGVRLHGRFTRWLDVLKLFSLDLFDVAIPGPCIGAMSTRLLVAGTWPYLAVAFVSLAIVAVAAVLNVKQKQAFDRQLLGRLLYWAIFIFYLALPSVSRSIFSARLCESFRYDDATGQRISYLLADLALTCDAGPTWEDETVRGLAPYFWAYFALWPVLVPLGFLALLLRVRKPVAAQRATPLSRATSFLWRDYSARFLFWEVFDLFRKIFLTSMVLFIDHEYGARKLLRTVVAAIVSAMFLTILALARPYRRFDDLCLACIANLLLTCCFASGVVIQLCDSTVHEDMCYELVGYKTSRGATTFAVALTAVMLAVSLAVILISAVSAARVKTMRLVSSKREPMRDGITLADGQEWHLFLSHVWSTGQDAVAVIKNELQQLLPGCEIFLDIDDLKNIGELEAYIRRSQVVLCFLSRGYLRSTNCLREVRAALEMGKPLVLVHEADPDKGGGTLAELRSECPEELQAAIFEAGWPMAVWHRIEAFQHVSLKVIAEALLLKTPKYAGEDELPLCIPGEIRADGLAFPKPVILWASTLNAGARELANSVAAAVAGGISITDAAPSRLSALPRSSRSSRLSSLLPSLSRRARREGGGEATHMLLYLNRLTWAGDGAEALAEQVRAARRAKLPIVMAHENDAVRNGCIFGHFFEVTPRDLIANGLYHDLAIGCHAGPHRQVSLALLAKALGATKQTAQSRVHRVTALALTIRGSLTKTKPSNGDDLVEASATQARQIV